MHLLKKVNWHESTIIFKNQRCIIAPGECVVNLKDISESTGINIITVHRIIKYFAGIQEIETLRTKNFLLISMTYLVNEYKSETLVKRWRNAGNVKFKKLKDVIRALDNIDNIDKDNINEKQVFVEKETNFYKQEENIMDNQSNYLESKNEIANLFEDKQSVPPETELKHDISVQKDMEQVHATEVKSVQKDMEQVHDMEDKSVQKAMEQVQATEVKSVRKTSKQNEFIDELLSIWMEEYQASRNIEYVVIKGKDTAGIAKILQFLKTEQPDLDTQGMIEYFRCFCKEVLAIKDPFIYKAINPAFIYSQINQIRSIIKEMKKSKTGSSVGQATGNGDYTTTFTNYKKG
jgi:hypothetical protein